MFALIAAVLFAVAFIINGSGGHPDVWFSPFSLALAGLFCIAVHLCGLGAGWFTIVRRPPQ